MGRCANSQAINLPLIQPPWESVRIRGVAAFSPPLASLACWISIMRWACYTSLKLMRMLNECLNAYEIHCLQRKSLIAVVMEKFCGEEWLWSWWLVECWSRIFSPPRNKTAFLWCENVNCAPQLSPIGAVCVAIWWMLVITARRLYLLALLFGRGKACLVVSLGWQAVWWVAPRECSK